MHWLPADFSTGRRGGALNSVSTAVSDSFEPTRKQPPGIWWLSLMMIMMVLGQAHRMLFNYSIQLELKQGLPPAGAAVAAIESEFLLFLAVDGPYEQFSKNCKRKSIRTTVAHNKP